MDDDKDLGGSDGIDLFGFIANGDNIANDEDCVPLLVEYAEDDDDMRNAPGGNNRERRGLCASPSRAR
ncbi:unnamed protein product [Linum trigynum]|uniref:Uncharacterized protein n=1 Tax=Linum trigynum TaxID=586398 RepID=A0AAV2DIJ8_9ROSI